MLQGHFHTTQRTLSSRFLNCSLMSAFSALSFFRTWPQRSHSVSRALIQVSTAQAGTVHGMLPLVPGSSHWLRS